MKRAAIFFLGFFLSAAPALASEGISTTFVKVVVNNVPLGKTLPVITKSGPGMTVTNLGEERLSVVIDLLPPTQAQLRGGAEPIPDVNWLQIIPRAFELEPHESYTLDAELTVPNKRDYRDKHYQVMIWVHGDPQQAQELTIGSGLLTRMRFKTAKK